MTAAQWLVVLDFLLVAGLAFGTGFCVGYVRCENRRWRQ